MMLGIIVVTIKKIPTSCTFLVVMSLMLINAPTEQFFTVFTIKMQ